MVRFEGRGMLLGRLLGAGEVEENLGRFCASRGPFEIHDGGLHLASPQVSHAEVREGRGLRRIGLEGLPERSDRFPALPVEEQGDPTVHPGVHIPRTRADGLVEGFGGGFRTASLQKQDPKSPPEFSQLGMGFESVPQDGRRLIGPPTAGEESRLQQEASEVPGPRDEEGVASANRAIEVASRSESLRAMEKRDGVVHLNRAVERLDRFLELPGVQLRSPEADPRGGGVQLDGGLPQPNRRIRESQAIEESRLGSGARLPSLGPGVTVNELEDARADDVAAALPIEPEGFAHPFQGRPVRVLDLRDGGEAHRVTSRHRGTISHSAHPGSPSRWVPKHSYTPR